ncbi:DNA-binding transcriptional regulator YhcF (GntR family) [Murinocardiopsis flavida]|uniref:DNA-binding transcriptional regulator YhcF (GntR family) n=1 Tax=Murinocardiopsis flavida TaxID=645275 RepID=A0A2P8DQ74_9ACTN|nr:GntR family transcriptional regulator [Murinocardiopsis flavida]PSK99379.1 DNA-binding transcriptional regulator YhcF (GntR family) [Murinocardiopsis flavida]
MFDGRDPIYLQIADQIRGDVLAGRLAEGEQVMSTTQYATTFRINPATAAKAFARLVDEGVLYKQRGVGMFVAEGAQDRLRELRRESFFAERLLPVLREAEVLGITAAELVHQIGRGAEAGAPSAGAPAANNGGER